MLYLLALLSKNWEPIARKQIKGLSPESGLTTNKDSNLNKLLNGIEIKPDINSLLDAPDLSEEDADLKDFSLNS